jgi:uncharacterized Zn finger protein
MYIKCNMCEAVEHISKWVRIAKSLFRCPACGGTQEIKIEG